MGVKRTTGRHRRFSYDESRFRPRQREAAIALVEYEFSPRDERKTKQQIADELGITRKTLYDWDTKDANFIAYKNALASEFMDSHLAFVYKKLIEGIERGSMKGIETYLKRIGDLDTRGELTINQGESSGDLSFEERKAALIDRINNQNEE